MRTLLIFAAIFLLAGNCKAQQPNIILILVDDLNDYVGVLGGQPQVETPYIDSLAAKGVTFVNAFCSSPGCAPSRTSLLSGKSPAYTQVYSNAEYQSTFRNNFSEEYGNATVYTIPEILKDSANYFTYALGKVFHSPFENDYDKYSPTCSKTLSWNKMYAIGQDNEFETELETYRYCPEEDFGMIPNEMESDLQDQVLGDSAVAFIHGYANNTINTCDRPFFLALGIRKPHADRLIPEKYFLPYYMSDLLSDSFHIIYNDPVNATPYNGIVMPPQPDTMFGDYYNLPEAGLGQKMAGHGEEYEIMHDYVDALPYLPIIDSALTDEQRIAILEETMRANYLASYIAAVQYMDSIVGKVLTALYEHPELAENTVVIFTSDHGYSLGEKRHWTKWALWETDIRVPLIISYPGYAENVTCKRATSLLDLFPTICDIAGAPHPVFPDGSEYLDGASLMPFVAAPSLNPASAAVTVNREGTDMGSCFPHYSVRTDRFHYIRYQHNNDALDGMGPCDDASAHYEMELYDIGSNRQVDPNEWNNIIDDPEYEPVLDYLNQFLPGGDLYQKSPLTVNIYTSNSECLLGLDDEIVMRCMLFNSVLSPIDSVATLGYTFEWRNNINDDVFNGTEYNFPVSLISDEEYAASDNIIFYLKVFENETGKLVAFRIREFQLHPEAAPDLSYSYSLEGHSLQIVSPAVEGNYHSVFWNFGDGSTADGLEPGPHNYAAPGIYTIITNISFGNKCTLTESETIDIDSAAFIYHQPEIDMSVYPNPASDQIIIQIPETDELYSITLFDMTGKMVMTRKDLQHSTQYALSVNSVEPGMYILYIRSGKMICRKKIEIIR